MQDEINEKVVALSVKGAKLTEEQKPSIRKALATFRDAAKQLNANRQKTKHKDREVSL